MSFNKEFIDWSCEIKKLNYGKYHSSITIADVSGQPKAVKAIDKLLTVGDIKPSQC
jgi:hypothetical protein